MYHSKLMDKGKFFSIKDVKLCIVNDENHKSLVSMIEDHNNSMEKQIGIRYSAGTLKNYRTLITILLSFLNKSLA
jgi:hypothetical protein